MSTDRRVSIGPCPVPSYPYSSWSRLPKGVVETLWQLVGPTVERNIDRPLWAQFCAVYFEGLNHGAGVAREMDARPPVEPRDAYRELMAVSEYNGRMFIAREKVLEYLNGAELRVTRLKLDDDNGTPF